MRSFLLALLLVPAVATSAAAQAGQVDQSSFSHTLAAGAGARAWGMGGAQIAVTGDTDSVTWNPAGLARVVRPAFTVSFSTDRVNGTVPEILYRNPSAQRSGLVDVGRITSTRAQASGSGVDLVAIAWPFTLRGRRLVAAVVFDRRLAFARDVEAAYEFRHQSLYTFNYDYAMNSAQRGAFDTAAASLAFQPHPRVLVGGTVRRWFGEATLPTGESYDYSLADYYSWTGTYSENLSDTVRLAMSGIGVDAGVVVTLMKDRVVAGVVYRGGVSADLDYANAPAFSSTNTHESFSSTYSGHGTLTLPDSFGVGLAITVTPRLLVTIDDVQTRWSRARIEAYARTTAQGATPAPTTYLFPVMKPAAGLAQSDTARVATGVEYRLSLRSLTLPVRAGAFYQQTSFDDGTPATWGLTAGTSVGWHHATMDVAYVRFSATGRYVRHSVRASLGYAF